MNRPSWIFTVTAVITATTGLPAYAATINQGDPVVIIHANGPQASVCTAGYVDKTNSQIYTAGHCGQEGDTVTDGTFQKIGVFQPSPTYDHSLDTGNDIGVVSLDDPATAGENSYSGDSMLSPTDVQTGETVCIYGNTTGKASCGLAADRDAYQTEDNALQVQNVHAQRGDSGGPVWVPDKGAVGVVSTTWNIIDGNGQQLGSYITANSPW